MIKTEKLEQIINKHGKECLRRMLGEIGFIRIEVFFKVGKTPVDISYGFFKDGWECLGVDHGGFNTNGTPEKPEILCAICFKPISVKIPNLKEKIAFQVRYINEME